HRPNYFARTIAHNTVLVYDPEEKFDYGKVVNDGGQVWPTSTRQAGREIEGSQWDKGDITAFETNRWYSYVCGDATSAYSPAKLELFTRQFLHIQPDVFVIFDRVAATDPGFQKYWLLHTVNEPELEGTLAGVREREGRLFCKTVLPEQARVRKVGGPGHEFEVFGRNYPPALTYYPLESGEEWGSWRIEVLPTESSKEHFFLHFLIAGDRSLDGIPEISPESEENRAGISFAYQEKLYRVLFLKSGAPGGEIRITGKDHEIILEEAFNESCRHQAGIGN
ncbi:MAG: hypothetical protein JXQ83_09505, partial [Candidatus Glassbacteria bacterium]|nr:hypothetical protein [Candidatus Glassbacteria bacterium]